MHHLSLLSVSCTYQVGLRKFYFYSIFTLITSTAMLPPFTDSLSPLCFQTYPLCYFISGKPLYCYLVAEWNVNAVWYCMCASTLPVSLLHLMYSRLYLGNKNFPFLISTLAFLYFFFFLICSVSCSLLALSLLRNYNKFL